MRMLPKFIQNFPASSSRDGWKPVSGIAPIPSYEYDEQVYLFEQGASQSLTMWIKVPAWYRAGTQINLRACHYSPASSNNFKFQTTAYLVRKNVDAITSTTNSRTSTNGDVTNTVANQLREVTYDLTSSTGQVNSVAVSAGDLLKVTIQRVTPSGTEDSSDVRLITGSTEVTF